MIISALLCSPCRLDRCDLRVAMVGSAETERADTAFMARLRKLCPLESLCLRFKLKPALVVADQRPAADGWLVPSGHIVTIFCAIVDPQLPFVNVLFPGFLTSPYRPS